MKKEKLKEIITEELRVVLEGDKMERLAGRYGGEPDKAIADPGDKDVENPVVMDSEKGGKNRGKGRTAAPRSKHYVNEGMPRNMKDLASYFIEKEKMGALRSNDARDLFGMYASMVTAGEISEKDAIRRALADIAVQAKRTGGVKKEAAPSKRNPFAMTDSRVYALARIIKNRKPEKVEGRTVEPQTAQKLIKYLVKVGRRKFGVTSVSDLIQQSLSEAGDPLRKSYGAAAAKNTGANQPQNRTNFRPGAPNPRTPQSKAPKPKPIKEAEGDIMSDTVRMWFYKEVEKMKKILDSISKKTGRRPRPGKNFLGVDGAVEMLDELWQIEIDTKHLISRVDKIIEAYKRGHK